MASEYKVYDPWSNKNNLINNGISRTIKILGPIMRKLQISNVL